MEPVSRRAFTRDALSSILTFSLINCLSDAGALGASLGPIVERWLLDMSSVTRAMRTRAIHQKQWQQGIEELLAKVQLDDLLRTIDYDALVKRAVFQPVHETVLDVRFAGGRAANRDLGFNPYFYAMKKGVNIVPHGHKNMATMHMVLSGEAQALHFDKISEEGDHILIRPVSDVLARPGDASTVSDDSTNIHWFKTVSDKVFMFNIGVFGIDSSQSFTGREYVDPMRGEKESSGLIRARRMTHEEAYARYSATG